MKVSDEIEDRLTRAFQPSELTVLNESHRHAGHSGDDGSGASHFAIRIRAASLAAMPRVARHRAGFTRLPWTSARGQTLPPG
jgi:BolA family transcriptional regulator, general stress-responsive regulator